MRHQSKQTRQAFGERHCVVANITIGVRTDETAQVARPHVCLDDHVAKHRRADAEILLQAICVFDGLVMTALKAEVKLEFGLSVVT